MTWIGRHHDMPLQARGLMQAKRLATALQAANRSLAAIYCGPLQRTTHYAHLVLETLSLSCPLIVDQRLNELDYGGWAGLTTLEICQHFGETVVSHWQQFDEWPLKSGWQDTAVLMKQAVTSFIDELLQRHVPSDTVLVVSSAGKLRYFLSQIPPAFQYYLRHGMLKIQTGYVSQLSYMDQQWRVDYWNRCPEIALFR